MMWTRRQAAQKPVLSCLLEHGVPGWHGPIKLMKNATLLLKVTLNIKGVSTYEEYFQTREHIPNLGKYQFSGTSVKTRSGK